MRAQRQISRNASVAAPVGGWNARDSVAMMQPLDAVVMDNVWPTTSDVMLRKGFTQWATGLPGEVEALMVYNSSTAEKMFAASLGSLYDVTSAGAVGAAAVTGLTNARWQYVNISNAGGSYLVAVNGADTPLLYNGATWANTAITGVTQANLIGVNLFKNRLWFVEKNTLKVWYLGVDAIAGAASALNFQSVAQRGGYLMAMATWTIDAGAGVDDYAAFVTSEGEVIIYQGTDPTSITTWALKGVWQIGAPLGRRCFQKFSGDLLLICVDGLQPMSKALQSSRVDPRTALTNKIQGAMSQAAGSYTTNFGWQLDFCPKSSRIMLNIPVDNAPEQYAMNTITGAWCRFTGIGANCWEQFGNDSHFGGNGFVGRFWDTFADNGDIITGDVLQAFSDFGSPGQTKRWTMAQLFLSAEASPSINASINVDFDATLNSAPVGATASTYAVWDSGRWDLGLWGGSLAAFKPFVGLSGIGKAAAMRLVMATVQSEIHWQATNFVMEAGGFL
jgi:hypothetical protein